MPSRIEIIEQEITLMPVDAIVNITNPAMQPQTTREMMLHASAGPKLQQECNHLAPCPVGAARITRGYNLPATFIIHTTPPLWGGGEAGEDRELQSCYRALLQLAGEFEVKSLAMPSFTATGYPVVRAATIAFTELLPFLKGNTKLESLTIAAEDRQTVEGYETAFDQLKPH